MAPMGSMGPGTQCSEGRKKTNWSGRWLQSPLFLFIPRTSSLQHTKSSDNQCRRVNTTATSGSRLVRRLVPWWKWPVHWTYKRPGLSPTESSYKFLLRWTSGSLFPWGATPPTEFTASSLHSHIPLTPTSLKILYSRRNGIKGLSIPSLTPFLLQMALYTNKASGIKILCKDTGKQMMCSNNIQSSALHIYIYMCVLSKPAHFTANGL